MGQTAIDEAKADSARARAEDRLKQKDLSPEEIAMVEASLSHALAQLHLKRRRRS